MKRLLILLLIPITSYTQTTLPVNPDTKRYEYTGVENVDSINATDLYSRAKLVITKVFVSGKDVTQLTDDNSKTIIGKGLIPVALPNSAYEFKHGYVQFTFTIQCKDNRYKYSLGDFVLEYEAQAKKQRDMPFEREDPKAVTSKQWEKLKLQFFIQITALIETMKKEMSQKGKDW